MKALRAIIRRELIAYFSSPLAYIVMAAFLLLRVRLAQQPSVVRRGPHVVELGLRRFRCGGLGFIAVALRWHVAQVGARS